MDTTIKKGDLVQYVLDTGEGKVWGLGVVVEAHVVDCCYRIYWQGLKTHHHHSIWSIEKVNK